MGNFNACGSHFRLVGFGPAQEEICTSLSMRPRPHPIVVSGISPFEGWDGGSQLDGVVVIVVIVAVAVVVVVVVVVVKGS